jgi:molecular chaperone GrpE
MVNAMADFFTAFFDPYPLKRRQIPSMLKGIRRLFTFSMSEPSQKPNDPQDPQQPQAQAQGGQPSSSAENQPPMSAEELEAAQFANEADALTVAQAEVATLKAKNADLADQYLRAKADTENARRRAEDEITKARKFAVENFAESLLPVADSLEAGLAIKDATIEQINEGATATLRQLNAALERNKVIAINPAAGAKFDPHQHQAISVVPSEHEANTVVMVLQKGYSIADRVLRPALVTVSAPK